MKSFALLVAVLASAPLVLALPSKAEADDTPCVGALSGSFDNVIVPPGATCTLTNSTVSGNVKALEDSRLLIRNSMIDGNVEGDKADIVQIFSGSVRQYILIKEGGPAVVPPGPSPFNVCGFGMDFTPCEALVSGTTVVEGGIQVEKMTGSVLIDSSVKAGNVKVEGNTVNAPEVLIILDSTVDQNLQLFKNVGTGNKLVQGNTVGDNLQCFENDAPFAAPFNTAGSAEGQCAPAAGP